MLEVNKANETTKLALGLGSGKVTDSLNFFRERGEAMTINKANMADRAIRVAVLEGYLTSLSTLGFRMSLSLQLQQSNLRLETAMWTAKSSETGFSVSFFWPVANHSVSSLKRTNKKRRKSRRKAKVTHNLQDNNIMIPTTTTMTTSLGATTGATMSTPINANPSVPQQEAINHSMPSQQESAASDHSNIEESELDDNPAVDLKECSEVVYERKGDTHGVNYVCEDVEEGWTPVVAKRRRHKVPTRLIRLRAPPHVRATLPDSNSDSDTSGSDCSLNVPPGANVEYSLHHGKPGLKVASNSTWTPIASRTRSRLKS